MQQGEIEHIIQSYFDAWNRGDSQAVAGFFDEKGVYVDTALNQEYRGVSIKEYVTKVLADAGGDVAFSIVEQPVINGDVVFLRSSLTLKHGDQTRQFESAELFKFVGRKINLLQTYDDLSTEKEILAEPDDKFSKSGVDAARISIIKDNLEALMQDKEPFKDPTLNLQDLSELLGVRRNQLSLILNEEYKMKFFDFINKYRFEAFIKELHGKKTDDVNITSLAYEVGFTSSSVFYKIFKRYQDISPKQYIKTLK